MLVDSYLFAGLHKGIPSLFADLKSLYSDHHKQESIQSVVEALRTRLASEDPKPTTESEPPTTYLWTLFFLAQHYSHIGQHKHSLELLDEALEHTPTLPDLLAFKARVLKRAGDPYSAARCMDEARVLDLQDRFLNTKCGKYRLRAGLMKEAYDVLGLFTKVRQSSFSRLYYMLRSDPHRLLMPRKTRQALLPTLRICSRFSSSSRMRMVIAVEGTLPWPSKSITLCRKSSTNSRTINLTSMVIPYGSSPSISISSMLYICSPQRSAKTHNYAV